MEREKRKREEKGAREAGREEKEIIVLHKEIKRDFMAV